MPYYLEIQKTGSTPYILIDEEKGYLKMMGESFHENVIEFYSELGDWLQRYLESDFSCLTFDCELRYFNSSTAKLLLNMLLEMEEHASGQKKITVNWITTEDNDIIIECGEDFKEEMEKVDFRIVIK